MQRSESRILTTHAGSLPRPRALVDRFVRASRGEAIDAAAQDRDVRSATERAVAQQLACGVDVGNDGEQSRESFFTYVRDRISGFGGQAQRPLMRDLALHPAFLELMLPHYTRGSVSLLTAPKAIGAVRYENRAPLDADLARFAAVAAAQPQRFAETFWTAPSPGIVACAMQNEHYASLGEYVDAVAEALRTEYEAVVAAGHVLQIDAPDLAMERHTLFADRPEHEFLDFVDATIAALNRALAAVPPERVRLHVCWGNYEGPHTCDVPLEALLPHLIRRARRRAGALDGEPATRARAPRAGAPAAARVVAADRGRDRHHHELRRAPGGRGGTNRGGRARGRRSAPRAGRYRLRLRHGRGHGAGGGRRGVGKASRAAGRRGAGEPAPVVTAP